MKVPEAGQLDEQHAAELLVVAEPIPPDPYGTEPIRAEVFGLERLEAHARALGLRTKQSQVVAGFPMLRRFAQTSRELLVAHAQIRREYQKPGAFGSDAEWLLDNFHIINEALAEVRTDLPREYYNLLPKLVEGPWRGFPRVYALAWELIAHCDSCLDETHITHFVDAYQTVTPLTIGELWAVPIMLRLVLVDNLRRLACRILLVHSHCRDAKTWMSDCLARRSGAASMDRDSWLPMMPAEASDEFLFQLVECGRDQHLEGVIEGEWLERSFAARGLTTAEVMARVKQRQAANQISIGNCVTSLRLLSALDWSAFFERTSRVEAILRGDPAEVYAQQDFATRDRSRRAIEQLSRGSQHSELEVARRAIDLAARGQTPDSIVRRHVGYYLLDKGRAELETAVEFRPSWRHRAQRLAVRFPQAIYFGGIAIITAIVLIILAAALGSAWETSFAASLVLMLLAVLPASELAIGIVHHLVTWKVPPRVLPKLLLDRGIPVDYSTFVVIPSMLVRPQSASVLLERLELHYLSNPDPNLRFALLTDFADAPGQDMPEDKDYLQAAVDGVRVLNGRYAKEGEPRFFLFHRRRTWNAMEQCWMGWERKRGKLAEFNRLLRGARDTSYATITGSLDRLPRIRYVITLDADTQLPREAAQRLIATLAHPLNSPRFDPEQRRVVAGYGVLQPRVTLSLVGARKSLFARIFAGSAGIDPYVTAVSDVYQDLFGIGSFTGKGIYDVDAFEAATGETFPENQILSHDLIEGNFARCGLVTDIEFLDEFPTTYPVAARRDHRWTRGDWQIVSWLFRSVPDAKGQWRPNPLPAPERWKIFDNLRRSLTSPALIAILIVAWTAIPAMAWLWTSLAIVVLCLPILIQFAWVPARIVQRVRRKPSGAIVSILPEYLGDTAAQTLLKIVFLAHQAMLMVDAVARTLVRLNVTRRPMLEWETAASTERRMGTKFADFCRMLWFSPVLAMMLAGALLALAPQSLAGAAPLLVAWLMAPAVAFWISRPLRAELHVLAEAEQQYLRRIARKTWNFFETYVTEEDHWLPPDNYQEDPKGAVAHRTSPTNMGLYLLSGLAAHDFGYLSLSALVYRLEQTFATFEQLEHCHGHLYNWYDTQTLRPLLPMYVSTVDSGNFLGCLVTLRQGLLEKERQPLLSPAPGKGLRDVLGIVQQTLDGLRPPGRSAEASPFFELENALQQFEQRLAETPLDLCRWQEWLEALEQRAADVVDAARKPAALAGKSPDDLVHWSQHLLAQVRDQRAELAALAPWLESLRATPALSPAVGHNHATESAMALFERWERLFSKLNAPASLAELAALPQVAADELALLHEEWPTAEGRHWFAQIAAAMQRSTAAELLNRGRRLGARASQMGRAMDFKFLYNEHRHLFAVGYNLSQGRLDSAHYDLLASEACLTSFLAVARGDVPKKHWFQLGRSCTRTAGSITLLAWGGTMFEYLMPRLLIRGFPATLLTESYRTAVDRQIEYGRECKVPWGISESAHSVMDAELNYQYQAFGVPGLGLKRGLAKDLVVAPYATLLALPIRPRQAIANLQRLAGLGATGRHGYYEAIDYSIGRTHAERRGVMVKCYMAHHHGMSLLALDNCLLDEPMTRRFHAEPMVRATELLLQERVPQEIAPVPTIAESAEVSFASPDALEMVSRRLTTPHTTHPRTHLISSGQYTVMVTNAGGSRSTWRGLDVTRWREDRTRDAWGQFVYLRDLRSGSVWSAGHQPVCRAASEYEVMYSADKAEFRRVDDKIETHLEVTVSPENHAEIRRLTITNHDSRPHDIELTSYAEMVLGPHRNDLAHPAFGKLFLETEYFAPEEALLCRRRPRAATDKPIWGVHVLAVDGPMLGPVQYETDRARFLGRGRSPASPAALDPSAQLSGTTGPVLDPIFSLRCRVRVQPDTAVRVAFTTALAETREAAEALADQYHDFQNVVRGFDLAWAHCQLELRQLHLTAKDAHIYQRVASHVVYASNAMRAPTAVLQANRLGQSGLWRHGISGDFPIVLATLADEDDISLARQLVTAHAYWRLKGLVVDLVLLNENQAGYLEDLQQQLQSLVRASGASALIDVPGGIFLRKASHMSAEDKVLLQTAARVVLAGSRGALATQLERMERAARKPEAVREDMPAVVPAKKSQADSTAIAVSRPTDLAFDNTLGGFTPDGREYVLYLSGKSVPPAPWVNVVANPDFGFVVTESGAGFTWSGNSQTNRLTPWSNDPVSDAAGEIVYLRDEATGEFWSPTPHPIKSAAAYCVRHGQGYTVFEHASHGLDHELLLLTPPADPIKIIRLKVHNTGPLTRMLSATFYAEWVLGTVRDEASMCVLTELDAETGALLARNPYSADYPQRVSFVDVNVRPREWTADRTEFLGRGGNTASPAALQQPSLNGVSGAGLDPCAAVQTRFELRAGEEKEIVFFLGQADSAEEVRRLLHAYNEPRELAFAWQEVQAHWNELLETVQVRTPNAAMNLLVNRWLPYQVLSCRLWGRSGFYQSSGAYGFRDQLQDVMALVYAAPQETRGHILRAAARQFREGDVQHWWHPPSGAGVRTRISDDFLFLPFVVCHYVEVTGDTSILSEQVPFIEAPVLKAEQEEDYRIPQVTADTASIYEHCTAAIENGFRFGAHGLPLMGAGDWNDGMNRVGDEGHGESVWNGWFLITVLKNFAALAETQSDAVRAADYRDKAELLRLAIEQHAWDGGWYRRAYFDDGTPLGSAQNDECQIDSLPQSWALISGAGDPLRSKQAMAALEDRLVRERDGVILLFHPPFDKSPLNPGYVKGYVPGIRENGGQYTHAAAWCVWATALQGRGTRAVELFDLLNPVLHTDSPQKVAQYRGEPYAVAGDVYGAAPHMGRGGWSWYTGSASWLYRVALEAILGFRLRGASLSVEPTIPSHWPDFEINFRYKATSYSIYVTNPQNVERGMQSITLDGQEIAVGPISLVDDRQPHEIRIVLGGCQNTDPTRQPGILP